VPEIKILVIEKEEAPEIVLELLLFK